MRYVFTLVAQSFQMKVMGLMVEPVVWEYLPNIDDAYIPATTWPKYASSFKKLWAASCFKGATTMDTDFTPIQYRTSLGHLARRFLKQNWKALSAPSNFT